MAKKHHPLTSAHTMRPVKISVQRDVTHSHPISDNQTKMPFALVIEDEGHGTLHYYGSADDIKEALNEALDELEGINDK